MSKLQDDIRSLCDLTAKAPGSELPVPPRAPRPVYHSDECTCSSCADIRAAMSNYLDAKRLYNINNWWNS